MAPSDWDSPVAQFKKSPQATGNKGNLENLINISSLSKAMKEAYQDLLAKLYQRLVDPNHLRIEILTHNKLSRLYSPSQKIYK